MQPANAQKSLLIRTSDAHTDIRIRQARASKNAHRV